MKRNTWKKTIAFVMAFTLVAGTMPANVGGFLTGCTGIVAQAAYEDVMLVVGGTSVTSTITSGDGWNFDAPTTTLTLNGANITPSSSGGDSISTSDLARGIYYTGSDTLNIVLVGTNTIDLSNSQESATIGIYSTASLVISGEGSLTVKGKYAGIAINNDLTISGGTVTAVGGYGVLANGGSTVGADANVTAIGGNCAFYGKVKNANAGKGWTNVEGTDDEAAIDVSTTGQTVSSTLKKVQFAPVALDPVPYMTWDDTNKTLVEKTGDDACKEYTTVTSSTPTAWGNADTPTWYVVSETTTISDRITVNGEVNLILADGAKLTASKGINVTGSNTLNIYGQSGGTGELVATASNQGCAGIGGDDIQTGGNVTISGGKVTATDGDSGAGIGGGNNGAGGTVAINGGTVTANGANSAAGIGGGQNGAGGTVKINGGTVNANGGTQGAGIGGGQNGAGGTVTISGGTVNANGGTQGAGIGGGSEGAGGTVTISGGTVNANGGTQGAGIGGGVSKAGGNVTISGGTVTATGAAGGAGIGGGISGDGADVTINGGTVTATGGENAAGIGGGKDASNQGTVTITNLDYIVKAGDSANPTTDVTSTFAGSHTQRYVKIGYAEVAANQPLVIKAGDTFKVDGVVERINVTAREESIPSGTVFTVSENEDGNGLKIESGELSADIELPFTSNSAKTYFVAYDGGMLTFIENKVHNSEVSDNYLNIGDVIAVGSSFNGVTAMHFQDEGGTSYVELSDKKYEITTQALMQGDTPVVKFTGTNNAFIYERYSEGDLYFNQTYIDLSGKITIDGDITVKKGDETLTGNQLDKVDGTVTFTSTHPFTFTSGSTTTLAERSGTTYTLTYTMQGSDVTVQTVAVELNNNGTTSYYKTVKQAVDAVTNASGGDAVITLLDDVTETNAITVTGKSIRIKGEGDKAHTITVNLSEDQSFLTAQEYATIVLQEGLTIQGNGTILATTGGSIDVNRANLISNSSEYATIKASDGNINISRGSVQNTNGVAGMTTGGFIFVNDGTITGNSEYDLIASGGGIHVNGSKIANGIKADNDRSRIDISNGEIGTSLNATSDKIVLNVQAGNAEISGGKIRGKISAGDYGRLTISGGLFTENPYTEGVTIESGKSVLKLEEDSIVDNYKYIVYNTPSITNISKSPDVDITYNGNSGYTLNATPPGTISVDQSEYNIDYTYKWQKKDADSDTYTDIENATQTRYETGKDVADSGVYKFVALSAGRVIAEQTIDVNIGKADLTVAPPEANQLTYTGGAQYLVTAGSVAGNKGTMKYAVTESTVDTAPTDESSWSADIPQRTAAGTYYVWYKVDGGNNYENIPATFAGTVTIAPKAVTITPNENQSKVYGTDDPTFTYTTADLCEGDSLSGALSRAEGKNVGSYEYTLGTLGAADTNYSVSLATGNDVPKFAITQKPITVTANNATVTYGDTAPTYEYTVSENGLVGNDTLTNIIYDCTYEQYSNVGSYPITPNQTANANPNYDINFVPGTLTVEQKEIGITWSDTALTYNGSEQKPIATPTEGSLVNGDQVSITVTGEQINSGTNYTAEATDLTGTKSGNYKLPNSLTHDFQIAAREIKVTADSDNISYGASAPTYTYTIAYRDTATEAYQNQMLIETIRTELANAFSCSCVYGTEGNTGVQNYAIIPSWASAVNGNYDVLFVNGTLSVGKVAPTVTVPTPVTATLTYSGQPQALFTAGSTDDGTIKYAVTTVNTQPDKKAEATWYTSENAALKQTNANTYYVWYYVEGDANHSDTAVIGLDAVQIQKAALTVTANPKTITYGEAPANDGVAYSGFVNNETAETEGVLGGSLAYEYSYSQYGNVGSYTITPSGLTSNNYEITFRNGTLTVERKEIGITWGETHFTYDDESHAPTATPSEGSLVNSDTVTITVTGAQTNAGTGYSATASDLTGDKAGNYKLPTTGVTKEFTIAKANLTIADANNPTNANPTYNGNEQALVTAPTTRPTGCDHIEYRHEATGVLYPTAQNPRETAAKYNNTFFNQIKLFDVDTDNPMTDFSKFVVSRDDSNLIVTYDGTQIATYSLTTYNALGSPSFSSSGGNHILTIRPIKVEEDTSSTPAKYYIWDATIPSERDAGSYTVNYKFIGDANHNDSEQLTLTSTISPLQATVSAPPQGVSNLKYNTEAQTLITAGTAVNGTMKYAISNTDNAPANSSELWKTSVTDITGQDTDTYKVWYKVFANDTNHSDSDAASLTVTIAQASALITPPTSKNPTHYSKPVELVNAGVLKDGVTGTIYYMIAEEKPEADAEGWKTDVTEITADKAGTYKVWYKVTTTGDANYLASEAFETPVTVNVSQYTAPSKSSQTWTLTMDSYAYDGTAHTPTINGTTRGTVTYTYYNADTDEELDEAPSAIGNYKVKVYASGNNAYNSKSLIKTYSITDPIDKNGMASVDAFKANDTVPASDGKIFAGWFTDSTCQTAYTEKTGKAYAKFIDEKILTVKAQISSGTTANSASTSIRFITSVDSLKYQNVGFKITFNGKTIDKKMTKVYTALNANGKKISPKVFSEDSNYMEAYTLNNIPQSAFGKEFTVTPYYTTQDGTIVEGKTNTFTIANMIK